MKLIVERTGKRGSPPHLGVYYRALSHVLECKFCNAVIIDISLMNARKRYVIHLHEHDILLAGVNDIKYAEYPKPDHPYACACRDCSRYARAKELGL